MRNYLILKERAAAFRADPRVKEALEAYRVGELSTPTMGAGEEVSDLLAEDFDVDAAAQRGMAFEKLDQLAMDHLLGVR